MFCSSCGTEVLSYYLYCRSCGKKVDDQAVTAAPKAQLSFKEFKTKKENERALHFRQPTKRKGKRKLAECDDTNTTVKVGVGIMLFDGQVLKRQRGSNWDININKTANSQELLKASLHKHKAHSKNLINPNANYVLLYSDGTKVEKLKECDEDFVLHKYKAECGKQYHRISFFLCSERDFSEATFAALEQFLVHDSSSDDLNVSADEEGAPKSRKLGNSDDIPTMMDTSTARSTLGNSASTVTCNTSTDDHSEMVFTSNSQACSSQSADQYQSEYNTLSDMFPQLDDYKIREALREAHYNIETAISNILETATPERTPQQVYASLPFCNNIDSDEDFKDCDTLNSLMNPCENEKSEGNSSTNKEPISTAIRNLAAEKLEKDRPLRIKVRRSNVWEDAKFKIKKCSDSDLRSIIKVQFVGEPAVDEGGPRNEFYSLLHSEMSKSGQFIGEQNRKCFNHDILALEQGNFFIYGQLCSMGIMQGSPSPCFFAPAIANYIVYGKINKVVTCIRDVPNPKVKQKLEDLEKIENPEVFKKVASFECSFRFKAGFSKAIVTIEEKSKLLHAIALHYTLLSSLSEVNQFIEGLNVHGFLDCLRQHPLEARELFMHAENQLTAEKVDDLFIPIFSPRGSNKRTTEEAVSLHFSRYLEEVESGEVSCKVVDFCTDQESEMRVTLAAVLQFITGSSSIPAVGFDEMPSITFLHDASGRKLTANTCANTLCLPINSTFLDYDKFKVEFTACMAESPGFGGV